MWPVQCPACRHENRAGAKFCDECGQSLSAAAAPTTHAVRAAAAALAIQKAMREYGEGLRCERGLELALRIGLNTGPVVVGRIGDDLRMDYTFIPLLNTGEH